MSLWTRTGAILVALFLTLTLVAPQTARADATTDKSISDASDWIADRWEAKRSAFLGAGGTADGVIALSAANRHPDTVRSMLKDLQERGPGYTDGHPDALAKVIMAADISGQNPRTLFGCNRDLVAELKAMVQKRPAGSQEFWGPYLIAIALSRAKEQVPDWVIADMEKSQDPAGGGFGYYENDGTFVGDPDYNAVAISAMNLVASNPKNAKDKQRAEASIEGATSWSADAANQKTDARSNSYYWATYSSTNSTGMLAGALSEVGVEVDSPVRYLMSQQKADGGWAAAHDGKKSDVMATTQAILGVVGQGYGTARSTQVPQMVTCSTPAPPVKPNPPETVYNTPGYKTVNGRNWHTTCEPYSRTTRCRTLIEATTVSQVNGRFVSSKGYVFNNLTYLPSPRSLWTSNPLGGHGRFKGTVTWSADGRSWRTECDTALTGRGGCRTFATARVIETITTPGRPTTYRWVTKEIFNNMVQFS